MPNVTPWLQFQSATEEQAVFGGAPWSNELSALAPGGGQASSGPIGPLGPFFQTNLLRISNPNLAGQLPPQFRLLGVQMELRGRWEGATDGFRSVPVEAVVGSDVRKSLGSCTFQVSPAVKTCLKGGPDDRMNLSPADVTSTGFGFQISGQASIFNIQGNTLFIDSLRVRIYWGEPITPFRLRTRRRVVFTREALA